MSEAVLWSTDGSVHPLPDYYAVTALPPAVDAERADELLADLPLQNLGGEAERIRTSYEWYLGEAEKALDDGVTPAQAAALLGNLDFFVGPLIRLGSREAAEQDAAQKVLLKLGELASNVPCGTVFTYAANAIGSFTGSKTEKRFKNQASEFTGIMDMGFAAILKAAENLQTPNDSLAWSDIARPLYAASRRMDSLIGASAMTRIRPDEEFIDTFTYVVQPNFQPITIGGISYDRVSISHGAHLALENAVQGNDPAYSRSDFKAVSMYLTPNHRAALDRYWELTEGRDLLTLARNREVPHTFSAALGTLLFSLHTWRTGHLRLAQDAEIRRGAPPFGTPAMDSLGKIKDLNKRVATEMMAMGDA